MRPSHCRILLLSLLCAISLPVVGQAATRLNGGIRINSTHLASVQPFVPSPAYFRSLQIAIPRDHGALGDGVTDDSAALAATIAAATTTVMLEHNKTYLITQNLSITKPITIMSDGTAKLKFSGTGGLTITSYAALGVTLANFAIDGALQNSGGCALTINNDRTDATFSVNLSFVGIAAMGAPCLITDINSGTGNDDTIYRYDFVSIYNVTSLNPRGTQFRLRGAWAYIYLENINIRQNDATALSVPFIINNNNRGSFFSNVTIDGNNLGTSGNDGISLSNSGGNSFTNVSITNVGGRGIALNSGFYVFLDGVRINGGTTAIDFNSMSRILAAHIFSRGAAHGLSLTATRRALFADVDIENSTSNAIEFSTATDTVLSWLTVRDSSGAAVDATTSNISIAEPTLANNSGGNLTAGSAGQVSFSSTGAAMIMLREINPRSIKTGQQHFDHLREIASGGFTPINAYGPAGNGADDTATFQKALNHGGKIYVPYSPFGYTITQPLSVTKPTQIVSSFFVPQQPLGTFFSLYGANSVFTVSSSNVTIAGFGVYYPDATTTPERASKTFVQLNTSSAQLANVSVSDMTSFRGGTMVQDSGSSFGTSNLVARDLWNYYGASSSISLTSPSLTVLDRIGTFPDVTVDLTNAPGIRIASGNTVDIHESLSEGSGAFSTTNPSLLLASSTNVTVSRFISDTVKSYGIRVATSTNVFFLDGEPSINTLAGMEIENSTNVRSVNLLTLNNPSNPTSEIVLASSSALQFLNSFIVAPTGSEINNLDGSPALFQSTLLFPTDI